MAEAVARNLFTLMAYKDEYEVARLYADGAFLKKLQRQFDGDFTVDYHLAPPLLARRDPATGEPKKRVFGPWMRHVFRLSAWVRPVRGTVLDVFGYTQERRMERRLIAEYEAMLRELSTALESGQSRAGGRNRIAAVEDARFRPHQSPQRRKRQGLRGRAAGAAARQRCAGVGGLIYCIFRW